MREARARSKARAKGGMGEKVVWVKKDSLRTLLEILSICFQSPLLQQRERLIGSLSTACVIFAGSIVASEKLEEDVIYILPTGLGNSVISPVVDLVLKYTNQD